MNDNVFQNLFIFLDNCQLSESDINDEQLVMDNIFDFLELNNFEMIPEDVSLIAFGYKNSKNNS